MPIRLDDELSRLVSADVLRPYQADSLRDAADAELDAALADPGRARPQWLVVAGGNVRDPRRGCADSHLGRPQSGHRVGGQQRGIAGTGFILVAFVLAMLGLVRDQVTAWSPAGAAMFSSSICWLVQERGEIMALAVGTAGPAALLVAYGRRRDSAHAVVACAILLVIWPTALYQPTDNMAGVAIGLVVASGVLLLAVLMLSRRRSNE